MFIRITKSKNYEYVNIVRTYRDEGTVKHKNIASLGRLDLLRNDPSWKNIIHKLFLMIDSDSVLVDKNDGIKETDRLYWGYIVYKKLWNKFNFDELLKNALYNKKTEFNFPQAVFTMVIDRLLHPRSKLKTYENQKKYVGLDEVSLQHLYRSLDILCDFKDTIEDELFEKNRTLFNMKVDVVFYDVTTFYFESVRPNSLKDFGYGKDGKFNEVQVVFGLLIDQEGRPIGFEVFSGNTFEGKTLTAFLDKMKKRFCLNKVVIVADRGLNSKLNLKAIKDSEYDYIVGSRIKNLKKSLKEKVLDEKEYIKINTNSNDDGDTIKYKIVDNEMTGKDENDKSYILKDKIICTWSSKRAKKDKNDRLRLVEKAKQIISNNESINVKKGAKKYLDVTIKDKPVLDNAKIKDDEKWDGYYGIQTSSKDLSWNEVLNAYHTLWKIEESFRILKTTLEARPMFHWTEKRIKGHLVSCFMSFLLERTLEIKLKNNKIDCSPARIRESLNTLQFSELTIQGDKYYLKSSSNSLSKKILRAMRIKSPNNLTPKKEFSL